MKYLFSIFLFLSLCQCEKKPDPVIDDPVPQCILDLIDEFKANIDPCDAEAKPNVSQYLFQSETVYSFDMGGCIADGDAKIYDQACEEICVLGTIVGIINCRGEPFSNAELVAVLWKQE